MAFWENPQKTLRLLQLRKDLSRDQQCMVEVSLNTVQSIVNGHWNDVGLGKAQEIASTLMNESSPRLVHSGVIISHVGCFCVFFALSTFEQIKMKVHGMEKGGKRKVFLSRTN